MERTFDYIARHDPRNALFSVAPVLEAVAGPWTSRYYTTAPVLDQGSEGACVGHGTVGALASSPIRVKFRHLQQAAFGFFRLAQFVDEWAGEAYEGTSVLGGLTVAHKAGHISEYRWCPTTQDVLDTVALIGPVIIGVEWRDTMMEPDADGLLDCSGSAVGGHCVFISGVSRKRDFGRKGTHEVVRIRQSWGKSHGNNGNVWMKWDDLDSLLSTGEAALPIK